MSSLLIDPVNELPDKDCGRGYNDTVQYYAGRRDQTIAQTKVFREELITKAWHPSVWHPSGLCLNILWTTLMCRKFYALIKCLNRIFVCIRKK
jgi:hypothetical protein